MREDDRDCTEPFKEDSLLVTTILLEAKKVFEPEAMLRDALLISFSYSFPDMFICRLGAKAIQIRKKCSKGFGRENESI